MFTQQIQARHEIQDEGMGAEQTVAFPKESSITTAMS